jgi:outer membrane protein OmpA-like peptidoglycan-associated protein
LPVLLFLLSMGTQSAGAAQGCPEIEELGAVTLEKVEPAGESRFAVYWTVETTWKVHHALEPRLGNDIEILRCVPPGRWLQVGRGAFSGVSWDMAEGVVLAENSPAALEASGERTIGSRFGNLYWRPMKGDIVRPIRPEIVKRQQIVKRFQFDLVSLFESAGSESSLELTAEGKARLTASARELATYGKPIIVEAFSNIAGAREPLRRESQVRAYTVAKYLATALSLPSDRFIPIGIGSDGLESLGQEDGGGPATLEAGISLRLLPN